MVCANLSVHNYVSIVAYEEHRCMRYTCGTLFVDKDITSHSQLSSQQWALLIEMYTNKPQ